jgi:hypothetical protein
MKLREHTTLKGMRKGRKLILMKTLTSWDNLHLQRKLNMLLAKNSEMFQSSTTTSMMRESEVPVREKEKEGPASIKKLPNHLQLRSKKISPKIKIDREVVTIQTAISLD